MMAQLEIHIPENWPAAQQEEAGTATLFAWLLRDENGKPLRSGRATLDAMPAATQCRIVVPASRVLLSSVQLPAQNRKKFMQALAYAVEDRIMADPENVHVAAGEVQENGEVSIAIVDRTWLRQVLDKLRANGLEPVRAEPETLFAPCGKDAWTLVWRGTGGFVRQGAHSGFPLDGGDARQPPAALPLAIAGAHKPASIQLYLDGANAPDMDAWSSVLGIPVTAAGEWQWPASAAHGIDLLQGEFSARSARADWLPRLRPAFILTSLILGLQVLFTVGDWAMLRFEKYRLATSMEQHFRQAFPDAKAIVDAPLQMSRNLAELRHSAGMADENDFLPLLARVAPHLGSVARLRSLEYQQGKLKMRLALPNTAAAESLHASLPQARFTSGDSGPGSLETELTIGK
jgi:general secretion pathway protein L